MADFVRCINEQLDFPANTHVRLRLASVDPSCQPFEMCRYAADFILECMQIKRTPWAGRYSDYTAVLHLALNWSFLIDRKPLTSWNQESLSRFLAFVKCPDDSWITKTRVRSRFLKSYLPILTERLINPEWRPCFRPYVDIQIVAVVMRQVHHITFHFLDYLWRVGARPTRAPSIKKAPDTLTDRGLESQNIDMDEMGWLFKHLERQRQTKPDYQILTFLAAVARFTTIPLLGLIRDQQHVGLLSQFILNSKDPCECINQAHFAFSTQSAMQKNTALPKKERFTWCLSEWIFVDNPGAPLERRRPLPKVFLPYLENYLRFQGLSLNDRLPDLPTLPVGRWMCSMSRDGAYDLFMRLRLEVAEVAEAEDHLAKSCPPKLRQLTFGGIRRAERANITTQLEIFNQKVAQQYRTRPG
jgi:hypothetical protein